MNPFEKETGEWTNWGISELAHLVDRGASPSDVMNRPLRAPGADEVEYNWHMSIGDLLALANKPSIPFLGYAPGQPLSSPAVLSAEVSALRREVAELKDEQRRSKEEAVRWARALEQKIDELHGFNAREVPIDPHTAWIDANRMVLQEHPDMWVILDPDQGIVYGTKDEDALATKLASLSPEERDRVMAFHTSLYT
jgi:hypothetical protein